MPNVETPDIPSESQRGKESGLAREMLQPAPATSAAIAENRRSTTDAMAAAKSSLLFPIVDDSDPFALLYSTPANQPLSLARRSHGTESLFQYYALRGYKEVLSEAATPEAARAVQACLEGGVAAAVAQQRLSDKKKAAPSLNTHIIDRCLVSTAAAAASPDAPTVVLATDSAVSSVVPLYVPLRPAQTQDFISSFRTQRADDARAAAEQERRERLRQVPEAAVYLGRYYPEGNHIVADVRLQLTEEKSEPVANSGVAAKPWARSPVRTSAPLLTPTASNRGSRALSSPALGRHSIKAGSLSAPSIAPLLLRTPQEVATTMQKHQESRHALADQIENAFVDAYHLRDPAAAQRQRDRELMEAQRHSMQAAAALLAKTGAAPATKRRTTVGASKKAGGTKKKSTAAPATPPKREGGVPANLEVFRASLLLLCNEDGAVTLDQLRVLLANVPFHVGTLTTTSAAASVGVAERMFHIIYRSTRAPRATDATDLLLAVASATTTGLGGSLSRQGNVVGDSFISAAPHGPQNSFSRSSNAPVGARRGPGANAPLAAAGRTRSPSTYFPLQASNPSVISPIMAAAEMGASTSSGAHTPKTPSLTTGAALSCNEVVGAGSVGKQPPPHSVPTDMHDGCKCVLVVELLDALDALLNSVETKCVVRWECFNVLAVEGNGYIHTSQLAKLRRCAYRDGSAAEEQAAVTAAMVKALSDVFAVVATEEEAAYLKANRKRKKKKGGAVALAAHQSSPIPLNVMRKSHLDYAVFCRFFDEMPLMAAAFAHVWLPLLLNGRRHTAAAGGTMVRVSDASKFSTASPIPGFATGATLLMPPSPGSSADAVGEKDGEEATGHRLSLSSQLQRRPAPAEEDDPNAYPLELLGSTVDARQAAVRQLVIERQEHLHQACDAAEKEKLTVVQSDEPGNGSTFAGS
ncbi:conserved hypothetical protein [Leishmania mexicana MHOM/GT/2001/U1103]|uniref:Uncharacterized protein n=1 Tax=Leishmania mexicana (strain MHOM/GT/2001/U1103) TaxID=929439 RepID=E9AWV3_LEIMU|nr:conserved hypothetical protein [Leishmania mexicana MHOM/GT/2001/U1103]CBZ27439.1 conserved hypothetical protein [Leishmania mexicana MHOM/GT/2001/U1103]